MMMLIPKRRRCHALYNYLFIFLAFLFSHSIAYAQASGVLSGRVTDESGSLYIEGARVIIKELGRSASSSSDGRYRIPNVPNGNYTLSVEYLGALPKEVSVSVSGNTSQNIALTQGISEEVLLVVGSRAGLNSAKNKERMADELKTVVASDAISAFADQNIAEALQRLPGINIERDAGEGSFATVRGLRAEFTNVEIDGVKVGGGSGGDVDSGGTSRSVSLDSISADILEGIEVIKTPTAEMEGDAVGATIALNTLSAFDRGERSLRFRLEGSQQDLLEDNNYKGSASYSDIFDVGTGQLGVALALTAQQRDILRTRINTDDSPFIEATVDSDGNAAVPEPGDPIFLIPERLEDDVRINKRDRTGMTLNLDYRPDDDNEYYFRLTRNKTESDSIRLRNRYDLGARVEGGLGELDDDDEVLALGPFVGAIDDADIRKEINITFSEDTTNVISVGGVNRFDAWTVDYRLGRSNTENGSPKSGAQARWRARDILVGYDQGREGGSIEVAALPDEDDPFDPDDYSLNNFTVIKSDIEDEITTLELNAEYEFGDDNALKFGVKSRRRDTQFNNLRENIDDEMEDAGLLGDMGDLEDVGVGFEDVNELTNGPSELDFFPSVSDFTRWMDENRGFFEPTARALDTTVLDYDMSEDVLAAYVQLTYNLSDTWRFIGGVRVEKTDFETSSGIFDEEIEYADESAIPDDDQIERREFQVAPFEADHTDVLPRLMFRWEPMGELIVRLAYTTAVQRPDFDAVTPSAFISTTENDDDDVGDGTFDRNLSNLGNPELDPARSDQWDLYLTWYPSEQSVLQAGYFLKDIEDFFVTANFFEEEVEQLGLVHNGNNSRDVGFNQVSDYTLNGGEAEISGFEVSYQQNFNFGGFVTAAWTFIDSEADYGAIRPGEKLPLIGQADNIGSLTLGWENERWTVQIASTYQDEMFFAVASANFPQQDRFIDDAVYTDIGVKFRVNDNYTIYADAINAFGEKRNRFYPKLVQPWFEQLEDFGTTYQIGVSGSF